MATNHLAMRPSVRLFVTLLATFSILAAQMAVFAPLPARAGTVTPGVDELDFEIDGDFTPSGGSVQDWVDRDYTVIVDNPDPHSVFDGGSKFGAREDWEFIEDGNAPGKSDILRLYTDVEVEGDEAWLRVAAERDGSGGNAWVSFELNQSNSGPFLGGTSVPVTPSNGDLLVTFGYGGNTSGAPEVFLDRWNGSGWSSVGDISAYAAANSAQITNPTGQQLDTREFLEMSIDVSFLFGPDAPCRSFGQGWAHSRSSYSGATSQMQDFISPFAFGFDTCAELELRKIDTNGVGHAGVEFELYKGSEVVGDPVATCATESDGSCSGISGLEPGTYTAYEVAPPVGFKFSDEGRSRTFELGQSDDKTITFTNPPITYLIEVTPEDDTNAVGYEHDFTVELFADFVFDYETGDYEASDAPNIALDGETVDLKWSGPDESAIVAIDGVDLESATDSTTCSTDANGACEVTVSSDDIGSGTLTAEYQTPLSGPAASDPAKSTNGGYFSSISDSGDKSWIGYQVSLSDDADNPLGADHVFTATVDQVNADGTTSPAGDGVNVSFGWSGPDGSSLDDDACVTGSDSMCQVTATSPNAAGKGTINVSSVSGDIVEGETLTMNFGDDEVTSTKTWWDYRVSVQDTATNPISESHEFTVTAERTDGTTEGGELVWTDAPNGTTVDFDWQWDGDDEPGQGEVTSETCSDPGTSDGDCTVTVTSSIKGTGTLTVTGIAGTTLPGYNLEEGVEQTFAYETADDSASKTWVDWTVDITPDAENPAATEHPFTIDVQVWDDVAGEYVDVEDGTLLTFEFSDPSLVSDDSDCTAEGNGTIDGTCTIEAYADTAAQLTVTVTGIAGTPLTGYPEGSATYTFPEGEQAESTKQWIEFRILPDEDATNYVGEDHTFDLTVQQTTVEPNDRDDAFDSDDWKSVEDGTVLDVDVAEDGVGSITGGTCTDENVGTTDGKCTVVVTSGGTPGSLTVVADGLSVELFDGYDDTTFAVEVDPAEQTKTWVDYLVEFEAPATNLLGDEHDFDVTIYRITGYDEADEPITELAEGVDVTLCWTDGNLGSALVGGIDGCIDVTTGSGENAGVATVTVTSPTAPSSGTLTIEALTSDGDVELPTNGVTAFEYVDDREEAAKAWIAFRVSVTPDEATNLAGDDLNPGTSEHVFDVHVQISRQISNGNEPGENGDYTDPDNWNWQNYEGATIDVLDDEQVEWTLPAGWGPGDILDASDTSCADGTDEDGTCTITVDSDDVGTVYVEVLAIGIPGSEVDSNDEVVLVGADNGLFTSFTSDEMELDASGEKTWVRYAAEVYSDAVNLVGDDHTFFVQITRDDGNDEGGVNGVEVAPDWELGGDTTTLDTCTTGAWDTGDWGDRGSRGDDADGWCAFTVSDDGPGAGTLSVDTIVHDGEVELDEGYQIQIPEASASKTWIAFDVEVSGDATNNLGVDHDFVVTVRVDDGSGPELIDGVTVDGTFVWVEPDLADDKLTCETGEGEATTGTCVMTVEAPSVGGESVAGEGTLTLEDLSFTYDGYGDTWPFTIDLTNEGADGLVAGFETPQSTKVWAAYTLDVNPPSDTNLLPGNEDHTFTVTLGSDDTDALPIANQELSLALESTVVTAISVVDADENSPTVYEGTDLADITDEGVASFTCTTLANGTCEVTVTTGGAGTATLTADFSTEIGGETFEADQAQGDKTWTTYRVRVENTPAVNLLGNPHAFDIYIENTVDGSTWTPVDADGTDLDITLSGEDAFIVETGDTEDCVNGTDGGGFCSVTIDSTSTGLFILSVTYNAENQSVTGTQTGAFSENGEKRFIDFEVNVTPDTAENLIDTDHVFEVEVLADFGDGFGPVEGAEPAIDVDGVGNRTASTDPDLPDCADGTGADGVCFVTITSTEPGTTTVTATYEGSTALAFDEGTVGDPETADFVDSATKLWVDYTIEVDPQEAINALDDPHTYTVTLERHEGENESFGAAGQTVELTLDGPGQIVSIEIGTVDAGGTTGTCTTDEDGTCEVVINSSEPGTSTLTASYDAVVGETSGTFTDEGVKQWAAIDLVKEAQVEEDTEGNRLILVEEGETEVVTYEYTITNIGPVTLTVTELDDDVMGTIALPDPLVLEPGASETVSADYTFTEADIAAGDVVNVATVFGEAEDGTEVSATDDEQVFVVEVFGEVLEPGVVIVKDAIDGVTEDAQGNLLVTIEGEDGDATVTYRYRITNVGDDDLTDLTLFDDKIGGLTDELTAALEATFGDAILPTGETITVTADHQVTAADFDGITLTNVVDVVGVGVDSEATVSDDDAETVTLIEVLDVVQQLPKTGLNAAGLTGLGLLLAMIGAASLLFTRRRRDGETA